MRWGMVWSAAFRTHRLAKHAPLDTDHSAAPAPPYVVGIAGGIGSGKSAVSERFAQLGIEVVDADVEARRVVEPGAPALVDIVERFGDAVLQGDGTLHRARLRALVFQKAEDRQWLERLLHPRINQRIARGLRDAASPYAILVNPLMRAADPRADRILVVDAPEHMQIARTMARDGGSEEQARAIMASQIDREARLAFADDVIVNDKGLDDLRTAVADLHQRYLDLAAAR